MKSALFALLTVGIWITLLCTAPQQLGSWLARRLEVGTELPWRHLLQVSLNALAVAAFIVATRRTALLAPEAPEKPLVVLVLLPLIALNVLRGPLRAFDPAFYAVTLLTTALIGFWEEFLFRGLIQDRLAVLGPRLAVLVAAILFALIHAYRGPVGLWITFSIGLAFGLARPYLGLWPLALVHGLIDLVSDIFERGWQSWQTLAYGVIGTYCLVGLIVLIRHRPGNSAPQGINGS